MRTVSNLCGMCDRKGKTGIFLFTVILVQIMTVGYYRLLG